MRLVPSPKRKFVIIQLIILICLKQCCPVAFGSPVSFFDFIRSCCGGAARNSSRNDRYLTCTYASNCSYLALSARFAGLRASPAFSYLWHICLNAVFCRGFLCVIILFQLDYSFAIILARSVLNAGAVSLADESTRLGIRIVDNLTHVIELFVHRLDDCLP